MEYTLIANTGIQMMTMRLSLDTQAKFKMFFREWYDTVNGQWRLELVQDVPADDATYYYDKHELFDSGYLSDSLTALDPVDLKTEGVMPLKIDDDMCPDVKGEIYRLTFSDKNNDMSPFFNKWLPLPYFFRRTAKRFKFSPMNWARIKLVPRQDSQDEFDAVLAFDTRAGYESDEYNEFPIFPDKFCNELLFELCDNEFFLMDYCLPGEKWSYVNDYIFKLVHPEAKSVSQLRGADKRMLYVARYVFLINWLASEKILPSIKLYKDVNVEKRLVDMVVDIGNSRTTALLVEDNSTFNQVTPLQLMDYTTMVAPHSVDADPQLKIYEDPFDMRLAFRKVSFGAFGIRDSKQFVFPSFIRLGVEANNLIHAATDGDVSRETLSTYSSPKRYLWDDKPNKEEWEFMVLPDEEPDQVLRIEGLSDYLMSDGRLDISGIDGGRSYHYSRQSLMTFAFLEMLVQANIQINSDRYRTDRGYKTLPRVIKRMIVTCPTAMSKLEREALATCARNAVMLLNKFYNTSSSIEIVPSLKSMKDTDGTWYYDEATCSQLVYIYGEVGYKYKGNCDEFFRLYGKILPGEDKPSLTVGSIDIGAGTSDLMISKYTYVKDDLTVITPDPLFYDSFYYAGDDMVKALIKNIMLLDEKHSAFRTSLKSLTDDKYRQKIKDFFGPDHSGQTYAERIARKNFNIQYSVPLMYHFLSLASSGSSNCVVTYSDVFSTCPPNAGVIEDFRKRTGIDITRLNWNYDKDFVSRIIAKEFEPLLRKVAAMFFAHSCDIILLSGRPSSLPVIRDAFLKYYPVAPNRLIALNNYYVGDWYPFSDNTGYITNPKTIVAMGGVIGNYASEYSNLDKFVIDISKLSANLKSTINYVEEPNDGQKSEYLITPENNSGQFTLSKIPNSLFVSQIGMSSYPSRALYSIDFNRVKMAASIKKKAEMNGEFPSDLAILGTVNDEIERMKKRMPFKLTIEKDPENKENLYISSITDRFDADLSDSFIDLHIQSLGVDGQYWLDTGVFDF